MPNTKPVNDTRGITEMMVSRARQAGGAKLHPIGAITLGVIVSWPTDQKVLVEQESESIVFIRKYRTGEETERIPFSDVAAGSVASDTPTTA